MRTSFDGNLLREQLNTGAPQTPLSPKNVDEQVGNRFCTTPLRTNLCRGVWHHLCTFQLCISAGQKYAAIRQPSSLGPRLNALPSTRESGAHNVVESVMRI